MRLVCPCIRVVAWFALWRDQCYKCSSCMPWGTTGNGISCRGPWSWGGYLPTHRWPVVQVINVPPRQPSLVTCQRQCYKWSNWCWLRIGPPSWQAFSCPPQCSYQPLLARVLFACGPEAVVPSHGLTSAWDEVNLGRVLPAVPPMGGLSLATACRRLCPAVG